ncbi:hypothetical protein [Thiomicrorhabdus xiamenensis]|uniref:Uncharacterized protein n=1 Tax=Thiomicrorhabdus xiamenensis TaxID=2739063 RepID=A0A7D4SHI6_9GAMM|nr:hypothetical protein [Thiomicrorhabdus xiamenensis]QKI88380.1 hypothetical protein HQN79_01725 [Thiomicrorhabdus xiamenensis]
MSPAIKKALRNSALLAIIICALAIYQGESLLTAVLSLIFSFAIMLPAFWLSFRLTDKSRQKTLNDN